MNRFAAKSGSFTGGCVEWIIWNGCQPAQAPSPTLAIPATIGLRVTIDRHQHSYVRQASVRLKEDWPCLANFTTAITSSASPRTLKIKAGLPRVTIYPPVRVSLNPTVLAGEEGSFATEAEAEQEAVADGKKLG
jgi:hypothetical protein